jgi:hypothetical protein
MKNHLFKNSNPMKSLLLCAVLIFPFIASAEDLTKAEAVVLAEKFVLNGYTNAPPKHIKEDLNHESIEWQPDRDRLLKLRYNSLTQKAIGVKEGRRSKKIGWSVAFDIPDLQDKSICRVVTMNIDGSEIRIEHVDGKREYFIGF